jgi:hypothetical protein
LKAWKNLYPPKRRKKLPKAMRMIVGLEIPASGKGEVVAASGAPIGIGVGEAGEVATTWARTAETEVKNSQEEKSRDFAIFGAIFSKD